LIHFLFFCCCLPANSPELAKLWAGRSR
jgi:hypothetical protein